VTTIAPSSSPSAWTAATAAASPAGGSPDAPLRAQMRVAELDEGEGSAHAAHTWSPTAIGPGVTTVP
jgi:hypothetical protein